MRMKSYCPEVGEMVGLKNIENTACPNAGSCGGMFTACLIVLSVIILANSFSSA